MKIKKNIMSIAFLCLGCLPTAYAVGDGVYLGGQIGYTDINSQEKDVQTGPITFVNTMPSSTGMGARILFGYNFNQYGAIESGYTYYAPATYSAAGQDPCKDDPTVRENAVDIVGKGIWPVFGGFDVFGKAGVAMIWQSQSGRLNDQTVSTCDGSTSSSTYFKPTAAIGLSYDLDQSWVADLTYSRIFGGGGLDSMDFIGLGISYHFTDKFCGQFLC